MFGHAREPPQHGGTMRTRIFLVAVAVVAVGGIGVSLAAALPPGGTFSDDDGNIHEGSIEAIAALGITKGCNPPTNDLFCPSGTVTRGQMAAFLVRALGLTDSGSGNLFADDDGSIFEDDIDKLGTAGITKGCNPPANDRYCPDREVTRGQMAAFLVRAFGYTNDGGGNLFADDDSSVFESDIDRLGTAGVTKGCNPPTNTNYCPDAFVKRDQMATFLTRALGLTPITPPPILEEQVFEQLAFQFGPGRLVRNPDSLNENLKFRQAVAHAIDKGRLVAEIPAAGRSIESYVEAFLPAVSQGAWAQYDYNVATSVQLLSDLCSELSRDCSSNPPRAVFTTTSNNDARVQLAGLLDEMLTDVGIQYENQLVDSSLFFGEWLDAGTWDLGEWAWVANPDMDSLVAFHDVLDPEGPPPTGGNYYRWGTPDSSVIDTETSRFAVLRDLMNSTDDEVLILEYIREAEQILADQVVLIPLYIRETAN